MIKTTIPIAKLPPTRKCPNASMTRPAASLPVCPLSNTTRVEATFNDRRNKVANKSTVGKAAKSNTRCVNSATIKIIMAKAMLKVKSKSKIKGGSGSTIIDKINNISNGPANT